MATFRKSPLIVAVTSGHASGAFPEAAHDSGGNGITADLVDPFALSLSWITRVLLLSRRQSIWITGEEGGPMTRT